ncbi:hypothetical protein HOG98_10025 [bacterium]|jgi:hypothetical protein|nr:hypothetical protein [bacterium]
MNESPLPNQNELNKLTVKETQKEFRRSNAYTLVLEFYSVTLKINLSLN